MTKCSNIISYLIKGTVSSYCSYTNSYIQYRMTLLKKHLMLLISITEYYPVSSSRLPASTEVMVVLVGVWILPNNVLL